MPRFVRRERGPLRQLRLGPGLRRPQHGRRGPCALIPVPVHVRVLAYACACGCGQALAVSGFGPVLYCAVPMLVIQPMRGSAPWLYAWACVCACACTIKRPPAPAGSEEPATAADAV